MVMRDDVRLHRIADMMGVFNAVIFAPEDLMLVKEGPANRRRYLDILISQVRPSYFYDLQVFQKVLQQRNRLLKQFRDQSNGRGLEGVVEDDRGNWIYGMSLFLLRRLA
jgi:DNA replication and repair protein RecF